MAAELTQSAEPVPLTTQAAAPRGERLHPARSNRLYWHLTALRTHLEGVVNSFIDARSLGRLIDFGCGNMPYRPLFEAHVKEYLGIDFPGNELADHFLDESGVLPFDPESIDVVLSSQVLEHVSDPDGYLSEAYRVLKPNAQLILSTHGVWKYHPDPTDFWRWTCDGLRKQIEAVGFEITQFNGVMGPEATALQLWQDAVLPRVPRGLRYYFTIYMQWRIRRADQRCPDEIRNRDACVYVVVANKQTEQ